MPRRGEYQKTAANAAQKLCAATGGHNMVTVDASTGRKECKKCGYTPKVGS